MNLSLFELKLYSVQRHNSRKLLNYIPEFQDVLGHIFLLKVLLGRYDVSFAGYPPYSVYISRQIPL